VLRCRRATYFAYFSADGKEIESRSIVRINAIWMEGGIGQVTAVP
jgi:hypothetical protein